MATTTGLVQRLSILNDTLTCVWIGPTASNTEILIIQNDGSAADANFANSMIQALASAATNYRDVSAEHGNSDSTVTSVRIEPV